MKIHTRRFGNVTVMDIRGKITFGEGSAQLRRMMHDVLEKGCENILLNLGGVTYMDSSGIEELVVSFSELNRRGGKLKLLNLTERIRELLAIVKLLTVFEVFEDERAAVASFA